MVKNSGHPYRPDYDSLPRHEKSGKRSCWGLWDKDGEPDHLGALNNLTPEAKLAAAREVKHGFTFQLDWAYHRIGKPMFGRKELEHNIIDFVNTSGRMGHDDEISLNTQSGSQWDGFLHYADQVAGSYYNNIAHTKDTASNPHAHSTHYWCEQGIVGRGVLLDWARWNESTGGEKVAPADGHGITLQDLLNVAKSQGVDFRPGDILLIRTGFTRWYEELSTEEKQDCSRKLLFTGVEQGEHMERWLWNQAFSAVAGDSVAWERLPAPEGVDMIHEWLLPHAGLPIGELWNLEQLAKACSDLKQWTFLLTSAPLNIRGGIASPPNAIAML